MRYPLLCATLAIVLVSLSGRMVVGQEADAKLANERARIEAAAQAYVDAFNNRDADKLASLWCPEAVYTSRTSGEQFVGRDAIAGEFKTIFSQPETPQLAAVTESIEFISPNVALERGVATVTGPDQQASQTNYRVVYVKRDGNWLVDRVTEDEVFVPASNAEKLQPLETLIGEWSHDGENVSVEIACQWTKNQNYISRTFKILNNDSREVESSGLQIIGWDPKAQQIRSWLFDSEGGFVGGTWEQRDDAWVVTSVATLADGGSGSFTTIMRPTGDGQLSWQKINQVVDGQLLPNVDPVVFERN